MDSRRREMQPTTEDERRLTMQLLLDMFHDSDMTQAEIRKVCEDCDWKVENCIDTLIVASESRQTAATPKETIAVEQGGTTQWNQETFQYPHGAIPKNNNNSVTQPQKNATLSKARRTLNNNAIPAAALSEQTTVEQKICAGYRVMVIMRGAPGSGKTYLANSLVQRCIPLFAQYTLQQFVLSSDDYFYDVTGRYKYSVDRLEEAHAFNLRRVRDKAMAGWSPIIVDNTNMRLWEMLPYVQTAVRHGYLVELMEPNTPWRHSAGKLALKNRHRVPRDKIRIMLDKYEKGNIGNIMKMLKDTKYNVPLPQMRTHPPIMTMPAQEMETEEKFQIFDTGDIECLPASDENTPPTWASQKETNTPKARRENTRSRTKPATHSEADRNVKLPQETLPTAWKTYEEESTKFWGKVEIPGGIPTAEETGTARGEKSLLDLLKEGVSDAPQAEAIETAPSQPDPIFQRHSINCRNENKSFASLRQIYPNKEVTGLWDLFAKCNGDIDWAVDILLKEDELSIANGEHFGVIDALEDAFTCDCDNVGGVVREPPVAPPPLAVPLATGVKPQRQRVRTPRPNQRNQDMKETIESCFVLGDEHYSKHVRKIRGLRNGFAEGPANTDAPAKMLVDAEAQTEPQDDDQDDDGEILEVSLDPSLVQQLGAIFKAETSLGEQLPEKLPMNVFIPRTLAKELYMLWVESAYNQMEEQRQQTVREDEHFARLLKNPKYEHCKQSPSNIRELLDMEMAWMIYNNDKMEQHETLPQRPPDLASHLTQMKLCEIFPEIPRETLIDILAAHGNRYTDTVEVLRSTMENVKDPVVLTQDQLLERALRENELLNRQAEMQQEQQQQRKGYATHSSDSNGSNERSSKSPLQPDEAKRRLGLRDFEETRNLAAHHSQLKAECYQKAKEAIQKGNSGVAIYYSQIANLHKKKIDMFNHRAANCIMDVHKYTQNNPDLLDLHYLYVMEAVGCLDLFLDRHITGLRAASRSYKNVFIITGRGLHSAGGVSTIKNKVKSRLKERNLRWSEVNPGLLKVKIFSASRHSKNI